MKTGLLIRDNRPAISEQPTSDFGTMSFSGFATGFDYTDFLLGIPQSTGRYDRAFILMLVSCLVALALTLGLRRQPSRAPPDQV